MTLESVTDLENKKKPDSSVVVSQLQCQEVQSDCLFYHDTVKSLRKL